MAKDVQIIPAQTKLRQKAVNSTVGTDLEMSPEQLAQLDKVIRASATKLAADADRRRGKEPFDGNEKRRN